MAIRKHKSFKQKKAEKLAAKNPGAETDLLDRPIDPANKGGPVVGGDQDAPTGVKDTQDAGANESTAPEEGAKSSDNPGSSDSPEKTPGEGEPAKG